MPRARGAGRPCPWGSSAGTRLPRRRSAHEPGARDDDPAFWQALLELQARVREYVAVLSLELILDEAEGYAYLRQRAAAEGEPELARLVARRQLGYAVSLMLALLRKKLAEFDAGSG